LWKAAGGAQCKVPLYTTEGGWLHHSQRQLVDEAAGAKSQGFRGAKMKIGKPTIAEDVVRLSAVREAVGDSFEVMVDANQAFTVAVCPQFLVEVHVALTGAVPNGAWVEYIPQLGSITASPMKIEDGYAVPPQSAGLGIDWDFAGIEKRAVARASVTH